MVEEVPHPELLVMLQEVLAGFLVRLAALTAASIDNTCSHSFGSHHMLRRDLVLGSVHSMQHIALRIRLELSWACQV